MTDLRKAAEMALEALETLWDILDDIDTASDMAKENDAWYRKRVEALQKKRWDTMITTDGYKLKGGPVEALRQALAQPVDAVNMSQERVDETVKREHEWVGLTDDELEDLEFASVDKKYGHLDVRVLSRAIEQQLKEKNGG